MHRRTATDVTFGWLILLAAIVLALSILASVLIDVGSYYLIGA